MGVEKGLFLRMVHHVSQSCLIPDSQSYHDDGGKQGCKGKPGDGMLAKRQNDDGGKQRSYRRSTIAAHLKDGLCQTLLASRCHLCHSRSSGMKHGRSQPYDAHRQENQKIIFGEGQQEQAHQCEAHADGKSIGTGMLVGIKPCEWLQDRRRHLEDQRDDTYLCKREVELILHNRIDGRDNRLNHIVQEMGNATDDEHGIHRTIYHRRISLNFTAY